MHEQPGLISLQRSQEPGSERSQANGKMFLFSSLKLFIKGSLLLRVERDYGPRPGNRRCDSRKRDCGLLTTTSPAFSYISYLCFSRSHASVSVGLPSNDSRNPRGSSQQTGEGERGRESGRNCVNYSLISASDPWITSRREY